MDKDAIKKLYRAARYFLSGISAPDKRIHPDFMYYDGEHWFSNERMQTAERPMFGSGSPKIRVLLNASDLHKLNDCPYIAKLGPSVDPNFPFKYCAFLYPQPDKESIDDLAAWVETRSFPNASEFTYGRFDRRSMEWAPGARVRRLNTPAT